MEYARLVGGPDDAVLDALSGRARGIAVETSGTTGSPREVLLSADAMRASAQRTAERLGGPGHWLLAVPPERIAGAMVIARAHLADSALARMPAGSFTAEAFADAAGRIPAGRAYTSLVPTQVRRLMATPLGREALERFSAVLVGGAPPGDVLPPQAVVTYGMSETCGGCVYDGAPLADVEIRLAADGRIALRGPMLADGYGDGHDDAFHADPSGRWFTTSDVGRWEDGRLSVLGRADDVIITGGLKVHPATVERTLRSLPGVVEAVVVGVPDAEWGERVEALVVTDGGDAPEPAHLADVADIPRHALPRALRAIGSIPVTEAGKIDRAAARALAIDARSKETS